MPYSIMTSGHSLEIKGSVQNIKNRNIVGEEGVLELLVRNDTLICKEFNVVY